MKNKKPADDGIVYVGKKEVMKYVEAVITQFDTNKIVSIMARGNNIKRAVDTTEKLKKIGTIDTKTEVTLGTEEIKEKDKNKLIRVSTIEIKVKK